MTLVILAALAILLVVALRHREEERAVMRPLRWECSCGDVFATLADFEEHVDWVHTSTGDVGPYLVVQ